jgi:hypothetical protein
MPTYRPRAKETVEAMQVATDDQYANRQIALWMHERGYRDEGIDWPADPEKYEPGEIHEGWLLPEVGTNFISFFDGEGEEVVARGNEYIVDYGSSFGKLSEDTFETTYEQIEVER